MGILPVAIAVMFMSNAGHWPPLIWWPINSGAGWAWFMIFLFLLSHYPMCRVRLPQPSVWIMLGQCEWSKGNHQCPQFVTFLQWGIPKWSLPLPVHTTRIAKKSKIFSVLWKKKTVRQLFSGIIHFVEKEKDSFPCFFKKTRKPMNEQLW